jgi:hypothetical protein
MSLLNDPEFLKVLIPTTISLVITGLASLFIGVYLEKFKNRTSILTRKITSQPIAYSSKDEYWGHISVYYYEYEAKNLNFFTIEIYNNSSKDLADIIIDLKVDNDSMILANNGYLEHSNSPLLLTNDYFQYYVDVSNRNQDEEASIKKGEIKSKDPNLANELKYVTTLKKYIVPVFNRQTKATFNILVENFKGIYPIVTADIIQKSIKLVNHENETQKEKRTLLFSICIGIIIFVIAIGILLYKYYDSRPAILWTTIFAMTSTIIGFAIYQIGRYIKRLLTT